MSRLMLHLLGPPRIELDGEEVHIARRKAVALLAYLAVTGGSHSRDSLAALLWPEYDQSGARADLRRTLSVLNRTLGGEWLTADREIAGLNPDADLWLDVDQFHSLLAAWQDHGHPEVDACPECLGALAEAVDLYQGDFLAGFTLRDSAPFDEWQFFQTESLRRELASALERLVWGHTAQGEYEPAIGYARRWLGLDPLHEPAHRCLMELYAQAGQRAAALRQYQECARILEEDLGLSPSEETTSLREQIRTRPAGRGAPSARPRHNLPAQSTPFVGREDELAEIAARLSDPDCRLLTLVGPGGSGKTRLALEAAARQIQEPLRRLPGTPRMEPLAAGNGAPGTEPTPEPSQGRPFEDGVFFVSLAPLRSVESIVPTVATAVGFSFYGAEVEARQQLLDYLGRKRMLLVLDHLEHLLEGAALVTQVLESAPGVEVLATSRARLNVQAEHVFAVTGMHYPGREAVEHAARYSAVKLFLDRARRARSDFELMADNVADVMDICRLVEGMPLGIVLAAAWVGMLTPAEIAAEIGRSLDFLETRLRDLPERQRSVRAAFDHSWKLLTEREREVFQALSVFRGGFTREAAQAVASASLRELIALADKSLLYRASRGRYEVHELLRQYAEEKLDQSPAAGDAARDRHCAYYVAALQRWEADLKGPRQKTALAEMEVEIENARIAWDWAAERVQVERLDQALEGLSEFYWAHWRLYEAEAACRTAASRLASAEQLVTTASFDKLKTSSGDGPVLPVPSEAEGSTACPERSRRAEGLRVLARILARQADFSRETLGRAEPGNQLLRQSLAILERPELAGQDTRAERAFVLLQMGMIAADFDSHLEQARRLLEQSLALYQAVGDRWWASLLLNRLSQTAQHLGAQDEAKQLAEESLAIVRALGDQTRVAESLSDLGRTALSLGHLEEAERLLRESVAIYRETAGQGYIALGLLNAGLALCLLGKFDEAHSLLEESLAIFDDLGNRWTIAETNLRLGYTKMHLGQYEQARAQVQASLPFLREYGGQWGIGDSLLTLGSVALAEEAYAEAWQLLEESVAVFQETGYRPQLGRAIAVLGYAARGLGHLDQAGLHLHKVLETAAEEGFVALLMALPATALLLADRGQEERAVELYALASRYRFVANSRWFEDVAGRHIAAVAAALPPEVVKAAQERGRARDLEATVAELLVELEEEPGSS